MSTFGEHPFMQQHEVGSEHDGERLDTLLPALLQISRTAARRVGALGLVSLNGVRAPGTQRLRLGELIGWHQDTLSLSLQLSLPVLHADDDVLVVHKPQGLAVHKGPLVEDSLALRLLALPGSGLAHRLDRGSSGALLIGRNPKALAALAALMEQGKIDREYLAIAFGVIATDTQTIDLPLFATDEPRGNLPKVIVDRERGARAVTHLTVLSRGKTCTLILLRLETGRTHQIRAHLRAIGHPLLGDPRYGDVAANERARNTYGTDRPMLHAHRLTFPHPTTHQLLSVTAWQEPDCQRLFPAIAQLSATAP
jgi:RluA family pseudouridine synthase